MPAPATRVRVLQKVGVVYCFKKIAVSRNVRKLYMKLPTLACLMI